MGDSGESKVISQPRTPDQGANRSLHAMQMHKHKHKRHAQMHDCRGGRSKGVCVEPESCGRRPWRPREESSWR